MTGVIAGCVRLVGRALYALNVGGGRAVQGQEVVLDLLGLPCHVRGVGRLGSGGVRQDAVAVLIGDTHRSGLVEGGRTHLALAGLCGVSRLGGLTGLRSLTGLRGLVSRPDLRLSLCSRHQVLGQAHAQHRAEVHLRGGADQVQLLLGGGARDRHHDVRVAQRGDLGLGHARGIDSVTNNRDCLSDVLVGDLALSLGRHGRGQDELGAALEIEGQVGVWRYPLGEMPKRKRRARRHDGDDQRHERAHRASLMRCHGSTFRSALMTYFCCSSVSLDEEVVSSRPRMASPSSLASSTSALSDASSSSARARGGWPPISAIISRSQYIS